MANTKQEKIEFIDFMLSPIFPNFNNIEHENRPVMNPVIESWDNKTLINSISKLNRELLRRDAHGLKETRFSETTEELHMLLYTLILFLQHRLDSEPSQ